MENNLKSEAIKLIIKTAELEQEIQAFKKLKGIELEYKTLQEKLSFLSNYTPNDWEALRKELEEKQLNLIAHLKEKGLYNEYMEFNALNQLLALSQPKNVK